MAKTLEELLAEYQNGKAYTPLTQEQMQQKAATRYDSAYNQKLLSAQQGYETSDQALAQQLAGLQATYDKQREQSRENYAQAASQADRQALGRGMQRSSYNNATVSNINLKGAKAQQEISDTQAAQTANLNEQRTLLAKQLADTKAGLEVAKQSDILAYMDELEAREYERQLADSQYRNQLAMQLYEYQYQKDQDALSQQNWLAQFEYQKAQDALAQENWLKTFNAQYGGGDSGGYSGYYNPPPKKDNDEDLNGALDPGNKNEIDTRKYSTSKTETHVKRNTNTLSKF